MRQVYSILVVDDEPSIRFFLEEALKADGHEVTAVSSGAAALEAFATTHYDLMLLDLQMPGMNGIEVLKVVSERHPDTPIIILTAHASLDTAVEALRSGAHDYLFKPCKIADLRESVQAGLLKRQRTVRQRELLSELQLSFETTAAKPNRPPEAAAPPPAPRSNNGEDEDRFIRLRNIIIDATRHVITIDGRLLELSPTEFKLLTHLVSEYPRVLSPQDLIQGVQGYPSEPWEAREIVRYHIYHLRRKIKDATGRDDIIHTVRAVGYTIKHH